MLLKVTKHTPSAANARRAIGNVNEKIPPGSGSELTGRERLEESDSE